MNTNFKKADEEEKEGQLVLEKLNLAVKSKIEGGQDKNSIWGKL